MLFKLNEETNQYQSRLHFKITQDPFKVEVSPDSTNKNEKAKLHSLIDIIGDTHLGLSVFKISCPQLERTSQCTNATKHMGSNSHKVTMTAKPQILVRSQKPYDVIF